ncbi:mechanosensitive ion channel family protein [Akkermansiaceae bacterium]|nr:mechanosensitive ion channel family protein [Akkermansiaceae bacterium]
MSLLFCSASLSYADTASEAVAENAEISASETLNDSAMEKRLLEIFQQIDALDEVKVEINSGVAKLSGKVDNRQAATDAVALIKKTDGVIFVTDETELNEEIKTRFEPAIEKAQSLGQALMKKLPLIAISLVIVIGMWSLGKWISMRNRVINKLGLSDLASNLLKRLIRITFAGFGLFIALEILDATSIASAFLGLAGVIGIAFGFAFRNIIENYLAGILLSLRNPFNTGDAIEVNGQTGKVIRLTSRDTVLMTFDGNHLRIPNSKIMSSELTNFSRNPLRRFDFSVGVAVELDLLEVRDLGMKTLESIDAIVADPKPNIVIDELGDSTVSMKFYAWINQHNHDFMKVKSETIRIIKETFDDHDIEMPEPIYRVVMKTNEASPAEQPTKKKLRATRSESEQDMSVDDTIDKQLQKAQKDDNENNMLS